MKLLVLLALVAVAVADDLIFGEYTVRLNEELIQTDAQQDAFADTLRKQYNVQVKQRFHVNNVRMWAFHADFLDTKYIDMLPEVRYVVQDRKEYAHQCDEKIHGETWSFNRMDQVSMLTDDSYLALTHTYIYDPALGAGEGVTAYVVDTGIDWQHPDFEGRASHGYTVANLIGEGDVDGSGHGTHVAGTIMSVRHGAAKRATAIAVKVLDANGSGTKTQTNEGLQWAYDKWVVDKRPKALINLSLGGSRHQAQEELLAAICQDNLNAVVSAGNDDSDACDQSPAVVAEALTVGASDITDLPATFSNWGRCVDIMAPGVNVRSLAPGGGYDSKSGTSMASPNAAGVMARYLSLLGYSPTAPSMHASMKSMATKGQLVFSDPNYVDTPNELVFISCDPPTGTVPI